MSEQPDDSRAKEAPEAVPVPQASAVPGPPVGETSPSGRLQAFDDVLRPLTAEDLASPGTQKIILYMLQQTKAENEQLDGYVERFHDADKRSAVLQQQYDAERRTSKATDIVVISGTTIGGALVGVALYFFGKTPQDITSAVVSLSLSLLIVGGVIAAKVAQR